MSHQLELNSNRILMLPWWEDYEELLKERIWPDLKRSLWKSITNEKLENRIKNYPITKELLNDFLYFHVERLIPHKGYCLSHRRKLKFTLFLNLEDEDNELELGIVHETNHFIYRIQGTGLIYPQKNEDGSLTSQGLTEKLIEDEAQRFVKENNGIILKSLNENFEL